MSHTEGKLHYQEESDVYTHIIRSEQNRYVASCPQGSGGTNEADARRLVACWNYCEQLKTEYMEVTMEKDRREEFEKWWQSEKWQEMSLSGIGLKMVALDAWQARQPEIDALNEKLVDVILTRQARDSKIINLQEENTALKAENERLRKDAERLTWLEAHTRLGEIHVDGEGEVKDCYLYAVSGALGVPLRTIIDATKERKTQDDHPFWKKLKETK